ncbi:hypothetical protein G6F70_000665 [Rhizopus microsporus]|nr:hypothetical protein G6F71_000376 [Rhizopus microsporus]KAG1204253.1 hypothetical protein G6F70_000665 [Rhizopus microsporus]KAG1215660.1 hypothetical protein G6F69_000838 [Rhizopus microsporus]KAG1238286.1 hypothetical protein G6F67_000569 [Rhizopus microsporus]KAG1269755.1 hypothetical protein G6F68_000055 [Rhizopus microsporus]
MSEMKSLPTYLNSYSNEKTVLIDNKKESSVINESSDGTIYYSLDSQHSVNLKRPIRDDEEQHAPLSRKASRLYEPSESAPQSNKPSPKSDTSQPTDVLPPFVPTPPDWEKHPTAWAYLQALSPNYENKYLVKKSSETERKGYLLGRRADCDIVFSQTLISKNHCLIYMETGANAKAKGIRIFLQDLSSNGTYVNKELVGTNQRRLLRSGDIIQLYRSDKYSDFDVRHSFYRIIFPKFYVANVCQDEYEMKELLGRGNFASVYRAEDRKTRQVVAIKVIDKSRFALRSKLLKSIVDETVVMMSMQRHPCVVAIDKIYNEEKNIYLVLEYVRDGELFNFVVQRGRLTERESRFIFWQLFYATEWLHNNNIAHRDLKPENILLVNKAKLHVKITDFGLAKMLSKGETLDSQCGTPNYVAPEILEPSATRSYGVQCDLWSLGVMLYICLCGFPPFHDTPGAPPMKQQIKQAMYSYPSPAWDNIAPEAKELIDDLLTINPNDRATCRQALAEDLNKRKSALGDEAVTLIEELSLNNTLPETQPAGLSFLIRRYFSENRRRYVKGDIDLDLSYITDRVIAMSYPGEGIEGYYRNSYIEVKKFLDDQHVGHYKVYNLRSEKLYDLSKFEHAANYPFLDHQAPPFCVLVDFCKDASDWLSKKAENVVVIHCKAGKGRTGTVISALLMHLGQAKDAEEAMRLYAERRTLDMRGVTIPSQRRYVGYYYFMLNHQQLYNQNQAISLNLKSVVIYTIPACISKEFIMQLLDNDICIYREQSSSMVCIFDHMYAIRFIRSSVPPLK